jgi:hypothetical protein
MTRGAIMARGLQQARCVPVSDSERLPCAMQAAAFSYDERVCAVRFGGLGYFSSDSTDASLTQQTNTSSAWSSSSTGGRLGAMRMLESCGSRP